MVLARWFGVTVSDADRCPAAEKSNIEAIAEKSLLMQSDAAARQHRSLCRGTHASGICVRAQFEIPDLFIDRAPELAARLAKGIFANPGVYPAIVRFANADSNINSDFKPDVRSMSFSVDLTQSAPKEPYVSRQDFSMQNARTLPINDSPAFLATITVLTARNPMRACGHCRLKTSSKWCVPWRSRKSRRDRRSGPISNCAIGAPFRFVTGRMTS